MTYASDYQKLRNAFATMERMAEIENIAIYKFPFSSSHYDLLPGNNSYHCTTHKKNFDDSISEYASVGVIKNEVNIKDYFVNENRDFYYYLIMLKNAGSVDRITFVFHGFNEKSWDKYLPWAKALCERTKGAVVLFPSAFHMDRAPLAWSERRRMFNLSEKRKKRFPNIIHSTLSNVAISMRLHAMPQRFIWSGLQTYYDITGFIDFCKSGKHGLINKNFRFDIFAYSIGGLLAEILKLSNYKGYFNDTRVCLFCSGAVFNRLSPVSKFILDSESNVALYSYLVEHFNSHLKKDALLHHYIEEDHPEGKIFHSMLEYQRMREFREALFKSVEKDMYAITLKKDSVIPSFEVINTLQGAFRDINIPVKELDFDYQYTHENPFPYNPKEDTGIDKRFNEVFDLAGNFFG